MVSGIGAAEGDVDSSAVVCSAGLEVCSDGVGDAVLVCSGVPLEDSVGSGGVETSTAGPKS